MKLLTLVLSAADLRSLLSLRALRRPTFCELPDRVRLLSDGEVLFAVARDRYRAVRIRLSAHQTHAGRIDIPLTALENIARGTSSGTATSHDTSWRVEGDVVFITGPASTPVPDDELFDLVPHIGADDYVVNLHLTQVADNLIAPTDPVKDRDPRYWRMRMSSVPDGARLWMSREGIELVVQATHARR